MAWSQKETISRSEMQALQLSALQKTVSYVYERNDYYRQKFDDMGLKPGDIKSLDDIKLLPFTTSRTCAITTPSSFSQPHQKKSLSIMRLLAPPANQSR